MDKKYDDEKNNIRAQFTELKNETIEKFEDKVTEILADYPQSKDLNEEETQVKTENNKIAKARENIKSQFIELENETMEKFEDKVTEILADYHKSEEFDEEEQPKEDLEENRNIETKVLDEPIKQDFFVNSEPKLVVDDEEQSEKSEENLEENKNSKNEETALTTTSKIPRFLNKFPKLASIYAGLSATFAALFFTGVNSNLNQHKPEKVQGREKNIEETKSTDDSYKKNLSPDKKQSLEIVEKNLESDKQYAETQETQETQESEFKKGLKARTESVDTMLGNMRKAGIDSDDINRTPEDQPVSGKNFDEQTAQVDESSVPEDKNKEPKKDLSDVKEATGATEVVKPTISEVTKKDETKTDETKTEETKIEDKGTVIKKDSDVTIVVTPEGETIKQEKDKDGNIKKEEHYVDENPFER